MQEVVIVSLGDNMNITRECNFIISSGLVFTPQIYFQEYDGGVINAHPFESCLLFGSSKRIVIGLMGVDGKFTTRQMNSLRLLLGSIKDKYGKLKVLREEDFKDVPENFKTIGNRTLYELKTFMDANWK